MYDNLRPAIVTQAIVIVASATLSPSSSARGSSDLMTIVHPHLRLRSRICLEARGVAIMRPGLFRPPALTHLYSTLRVCLIHKSSETWRIFRPALGPALRGNLRVRNVMNDRSLRAGRKVLWSNGGRQDQVQGRLGD